MKCISYQSIDSTNLQARRLWEELSSPGEPFAVCAEEQTAGVGRYGRVWQSPPGGLWMTVVWPARSPLHLYQAVPLAAGHALASLLENVYGLSSQIKWPNDVLVKGRKIAGILCQSQASPRPAAVFIGVGINGNYQVSGLGGELRCPPTSLLEETGSPVDLALFRNQFLDMLESVLEDYEKSSLRNMISPMRNRLAWLGEKVRGEGASAHGPIEGEIVGLGDDGALLLKSNGTIHSYVSGELERLTIAASKS